MRAGRCTHALERYRTTTKRGWIGRGKSSVVETPSTTRLEPGLHREADGRCRGYESHQPDFACGECRRDALEQGTRSQRRNFCGHYFRCDFCSGATCV